MLNVMSSKVRLTDILTGEGILVDVLPLRIIWLYYKHYYAKYFTENVVEQYECNR